jgi:tetratricopeptide (TPR) repeat protein
MEKPISTEAAAFMESGRAAFAKGDYDRAIADYTQAIRLNPNSTTIYNNRGNAYSNKGDYDHAIADYTQAIRLDPNSATAYNNRGTAYSEGGDYDQAIADFEVALRINPNDDVARYNLERARRMRGNKPESGGIKTMSVTFKKIKDVFWMIGGVIVIVGLLGMGIVWVYRYFTTPISFEKPIDDSVNTACLYIQKDLTMVEFNGQKVTRSAGFGSRAAAVNVPEGNHTVVFNYKEDTGNATITADGLVLSIPFENGQYYYVNYEFLDKNGSKIRGYKKGSKISIYWDKTEEGVYRSPKR